MINSLLDSVSLDAPPLERAEQLQTQAATVGFDWPIVDQVLSKLQEEIQELSQAIASDASAQKLTEELGDIMFCCVNLARHLNIDATESLQHANVKFMRRFRYIEQILAKEKQDINTATLPAMEALWEAAKQLE